ncbi:MAG: hypothetical protein JNM39_06370 [Bdellovibrionaceae bacterium]|nr:hypothetical protein [Pseudobdellovibrionaceae bacterium]
MDFYKGRVRSELMVFLFDNFQWSAIIVAMINPLRLSLLVILLQFVSAESNAQRMFTEFNYLLDGAGVLVPKVWGKNLGDSNQSTYEMSNEGEKSRLIISRGKDKNIESIVGVKFRNSSLENLEVLRFSTADRKPESLTKCVATECHTLTRAYCKELLRNFPQKSLKKVISCVKLEQEWGNFLGKDEIQKDLTSSQIKDLDLAHSKASSFDRNSLQHLLVSSNIKYLWNTSEDCKSAFKSDSVEVTKKQRPEAPKAIN